MRYDVAVTGNDEAAIEIALAAAAADQRVVSVLPEVSHSSWMMAQALKRLTMELLTDRTPIRAGLCRSLSSPRILLRMLANAVAAETAECAQLLNQQGVDVVYGETRFISQGVLSVSSGGNCSRTLLSARSVVVGTGVRCSPLHRGLGLVSLMKPDSLFAAARLPERLTVLGGGDFGAGLACLFSLCGVRSAVFTERRISPVMTDLMTDTGVDVRDCDDSLRLFTELHASDSEQIVDLRRQTGWTRQLNLSAVGVEPDENGQLWCAENFETWCSSVFGIGDVVGYGPETVLSAASQAARVANRILHRIPRPHFLNSSVRKSVSSRLSC